MMEFVGLWLFQDLLEVLLLRVTQAPELFLLGVVYRLLTLKEGEERLWAIWTAFVGGLLWDLRWVGIPGFFTLGYVAVVMLVLWMWSAIPSQGRTMFVAFLLLEASLVIPPLIPVLIVGGGVSGGFFLVQQLCSLPALLLCLHLYSKHMRSLHA